MWKSAVGRTAGWLALGLTMVACSVWSSPEPGIADGGGGAIGERPEAKPPAILIPPTPLPDLGPAPEINNQVWLNTERPLRLSGLVGKVVLIEFWTYGWINCQRVIPWVREWYDKYEGDDFIVLGVHYPEFSRERVLENVRDATERLEINYPVAIDNDGLTWRAYRQRYWPTRYVIDKRGHIRYQHIGEVAYAETEAVILALMAEPDPTSK